MTQIQPYKPLAPADRDAIVKPVTDGLSNLVFGSPGLFDDRPGFIAAPPGSNPLVNAVRDISRLNCRIWAARDKSELSTRVNTGNAQLCKPYLESIGEYPVEGEVGPLVDGGQCPVFYNIRGSATQADAGCNEVTFPFEVNGVIGPVSFRRVTTEGGVENPNPLCPGFAYRRVDYIDGNGSVSPMIGAGSGIRINSISISRADGLPDDCGNGLPEIQPPSTVVPVSPIPPSIEVNLPGFGPVNVNVDLNPDGDPVVCFEEAEVCVTIQPPGVDGGGGGGGGTPPLDPEIGSPIEGPPAGGGGGGGDDTPFGPPPDGRIWIGAFVQVLGDMVPWGVVPGSAPENAALTRVVGNASLIVDNGVVARVRSRAMQIRSEWSEHFVPYPGLIVNGIRVNINPALSYRVYPVSVEDPKALET